MRIAALYDIHGNLPALEAVLEDIRSEGVDRIVIGGDVMPGPMVAATLARIDALDVPVHCIHGNGESAVLAWHRGHPLDSLPETARESIRSTAEALTPVHIERLSAWPGTFRMDVPSFGAVLFCHATPRNDTEVFTMQTAEDRLRPVFDPAGVPLVVCGHTHMQFDRRVGRTRVVNAGSVGMAFGSSAAEWLLLGPDVELRRTVYDRERAAARLRGAGGPHADDFVARFVLHPPSAQEMMERFSKVELSG